MNEPEAATCPVKWWRSGRLWSWVILTCVLALTAGVRFRLREMPLERDEGEYAYTGQMMLEGIPPWKSAYSMKLPGTAAAYGVLMALFGQSCAGVHLGLLVVNAGSIVLVFVLARQLIGFTASWVAAATYALMSLSGSVLGTAGHATHFVVLPALAGLVLLWRATASGDPIAYLGSGFFLGVGMLMKQNGAFFVGFGAIWLVWVGCSRKIMTTGPFLKNCGAFFSGAAVPLLVMLLLLWHGAVLERFWFWTFDYARTYGGQNPGLDLAWRRLVQRMPPVELPAFYAAFFGLAALWSRRARRPAALFATALLACSLVAIVPGFHFRSHYYVLVMPVLALLTGAAVQTIVEFFVGLRFSFLAPAPVLAFAFLFAKGVARERELFFQLSPSQACRQLYGDQPFPEAITIAEYIRAHCPPNERIAVLGSEPEIYFYARRHSATGYIYMYPLMERQPYARQMQDEMIKEIEAARPRYLVQIRTWTSWRTRPGATALIGRMCDAMTPPEYELAGSADIFDQEPHVEWRWGQETLHRATNAAISLLVFRRPDQTLEPN